MCSLPTFTEITYRLLSKWLGEDFKSEGTLSWNKCIIMIWFQKCKHDLNESTICWVQIPMLLKLEQMCGGLSWKWGKVQLSREACPGNHVDRCEGLLPVLGTRPPVLGGNVGCWAARAFRKQAGLSSEVGSTGLRVSAQLSSSRSLGRQGRCRAAAAVPLSWEGRTLSPAAGAGTAGLSPTSRRTAPSPTGLGRHWILPSSARKQWLSLQWWKERNGAPSTTPLRWVSCLPLWTLILSHKTK